MVAMGGARMDRIALAHHQSRGGFGKFAAQVFYFLALGGHLRGDLNELVQQNVAIRCGFGEFVQGHDAIGIPMFQEHRVRLVGERRGLGFGFCRGPNPELAKACGVIFFKGHFQLEVAPVGKRGGQLEHRTVGLALHAINRPAALQIVVERLVGGVFILRVTLRSIGEGKRLACRRSLEV